MDQVLSKQDISQIEHEWRQGGWRKTYRLWVDDNKNNPARLEYLSNEAKKLESYILYFQGYLKRIIPKASTWWVKSVKNMKDVFICSLGNGKALYRNSARYMIYEFRRPKNTFACGTNYHQKIKKLRSIYYEMELISDKKDVDKIGQREIELAKQIPITNYLEFNRAGFAVCPFHKEKTPSMKYYKNSNKVHCFGCGFTGDSIDVVQKLHNVDFVEAVKKLLNL